MTEKAMVILKPDGSVMRVPAVKKPSLTELQKLVGGYMEPTKCRYEGRVRWMLLSEEGKFEGLPVNQKASEAYRAYWARRGQSQEPGATEHIVGTAVILIGWQP